MSDSMDESSDRARYAPLEDYALIGDCRSAALISRSGSVDWLCWPRFDSPSVFAAVLDAAKGGSFSIRPATSYSVARRYLPETAALETTFSTATGVLRLVDVMPIAPEAERRKALLPDYEILRSVECLDGEVEVEIRYAPRPHYARQVPRLVDRGPLGLVCSSRGQLLTLRSDVPLRVSADGASAEGREILRRGEGRCISLCFEDEVPAVVPLLGGEAARRRERTIVWWQRWCESCTYDGPYRDAVLRSAITLRLLTFSPSGAVVAAPTTSLPERLGGRRNWDYRFCWLRDASLTLQALFDLGFSEAALGFLSWLFHTTRMTRRPELSVVYDVYGEKRLPESVLAHLEGYRGSRPVRVGNAAASQLQLDIYGEVADAAYEFVARGGALHGQTARLLVALGHTVCRLWEERDEGIWEPRGGRRHNTYSKVMCWVALDRILRLHEQEHLRAPVETFRCVREAIRETVEREGFNEELGSYTSELGGDDVDASLLLLARYGFVEPTDERWRGTCRLIEERLAQGPLLRRYRNVDDGLPQGEGAFGICSFWAVEALARRGEVESARKKFEELLAFANDVGLFAEEIDPETGAALGNFPQAFTHVGLIDAALALDRRRWRVGHPGSRPPRPERRVRA